MEKFEPEQTANKIINIMITFFSKTLCLKYLSGTAKAPQNHFYSGSGSLLQPDIELSPNPIKNYHNGMYDKERYRKTK